MMIIFGQQDYAERVNCYLRKISPQNEIEVIAFPLSGENPAEYVFDYSLGDEKLSSMKKDDPIIVAFGSKYQEEAAEHLRNHGFTNLSFFDSKMDNEMKKEFFKKEFARSHKDFSIIGEEKTVAIYMAKSIVDKSLNNYPQNIYSYIVPIQVGAALTDKRIAALTDDTGENISERNRHYSETTALYWMWKNAEADYLGLCHYRRLWSDLELIVEKIQQDMIDVVLPVPTLCVHSVAQDYMQKYIPDVYPTMLDVLKEMSPEYYEASEEIYKGHIFYACNMLIAKRSILHELCRWMFPIVMEIERRVGDLPDPYFNRYAGFCTERLITLYFLYNKPNWHITHADKIFIE